MKLSAVKSQLTQLQELNFKLPDGSYVSKHFHVTEIGSITKKFIDCGGTLREEEKIGFQLWEANDFDHRLAPAKLSGIIEIAESQLGIEDREIEVEYQGATIQKFGLEFDGKDFVLMALQTDCLAQDKCEVPPTKMKLDLNSLTANNCTPGGGCC